MPPRRRSSDLDMDKTIELRDLLEEVRKDREWHRQLKGAGREDRGGRSIGLRIGRFLSLNIRTKQAITVTTIATVMLSAAAYVWPEKFAVKKIRSATEIGSPAWVESVDSHVRKGEAALGRLGAVESQVGTLRVEQSSMRVELIDMRIDSLEQWEWQAEKEGDPRRRDELRAKISALRRKLAIQRP